MSAARTPGAAGVDGEIGRVPDAEWIAAGFRWSTAAPLTSGQAGLWQRRVRDARGTAYFVTVFAWDWREFQPRCPYAWSYALDCSFIRGDESFRVERSVKSPVEASAFADEVWRKLGCDHYELDEDGDTPASPGGAAGDGGRDG